MTIRYLNYVQYRLQSIAENSYETLIRRTTSPPYKSNILNKNRPLEKIRKLLSHKTYHNALIAFLTWSEAKLGLPIKTLTVGP